MTLEEAIKLLKQYQGYEPMFPDGETLKHAFDLTDETVDTLLTALRPVSLELVEADRDGRCVVQEYNPGDPVWVVERDEIDEPDCVSGYVFVAYADGVVIVHPYIGDCGEIDAILYDCITETRENGECDLEVFPIEDCYCSKEDAKNALKGDRHETD